LRLRHGGPSDDNIYLDTAPASAANPPAPGDWVARGSAPRTLTITAAKVALGTDTYASVASPVAVYFDGFNTATAGAVTYNLTASPGAFTMTGNAVGLRRGLRLTVSAGAFVLTGNAAAFRHAYRLQALTGAFSMAGMDALLTYHANVLAFVRAAPPALAAITDVGTPAAATLVPRATPLLATISAAASPGTPGGFVRATPPPLADLN
jgi:hypothetical protein